MRNFFEWVFLGWVFSCQPWYFWDILLHGSGSENRIFYYLQTIENPDPVLHCLQVNAYIILSINFFIF